MREKLTFLNDRAHLIFRVLTKSNSTEGPTKIKGMSMSHLTNMQLIASQITKACLCSIDTHLGCLG